MQTQGMLEQHQALAQVAPHIRLGSPLRCDGPGRLDAAEDIRTGTPMAVRWIPLEAKGEETAAAAAALPRHPALPTVRLTGVASRHAWVALDYPEGRLLSSRLPEGFSPEWVGLVGETVADAFALLHARGVVHGELSAESILLHGRHVAVWDLPLLVMGRICERRKEQRQVSRLHVTAPYLAPERLRGGGPSEAGDVYALGVLVARMLGAPGPTAAPGLALVHQVATGEWKPVVPPGTPAALRPLLERMLDEEPEVRPSMAEVSARMRLAIPPPTRTEPEMPAIVMGAPQGAPIQVAV
ncbi:MAG: protein kinase, partial [Deltaproteobacteria bacterium]|nr:protein kinase [Deltaproteobacteria bacterium]